ncbi:MAG TPA: DUF5719 family protein [Streptosporangiaceae bacterium]|nr:DUF5719 family protein [Streptosporangiaceae bacterium]
MTSLRANRVIAPLAVVIVLGAVYALTTFGRSATLGAGRQVPPPRSAAATSVMRACPSPGLASSAATDVALIAAPATAGRGQAEVSRLAGAAGTTPLHSMTSPGQLSIATVRAARTVHRAAAAPASGLPVPTVTAQGGVVVQASGSMARGLEVEQIAGGIPSARCESPGTDFWFAGPGQHGLARIQLYLLNPGSQPADANVEVFTDAGPLQGNPDTGISVAPHSMVVQSLTVALRGSRALALHVRTSVGQVVAAVQETTRAGGSGAWLPVAQTPATQVVLPGLPAAAGTRQLFVAVPGTADAHLKLIAVTARGSYPPTGGTGLDIPGGSAAAIVLPSLSGIPAALKLSANVPITASVMLTGGSPGAPGVFTAASLPLQEQGVVAYDRVGGGMASQLVLSAPGRAVTARITEIGVPGAARPPQIVQISAGHSVLAPLGRAGGSGRKAAFSVTITPLAGSGPLYAGRVIIGSGTGGKVKSLLPVDSALTMVPLPHVQDTFITSVP